MSITPIVYEQLFCTKVIGTAFMCLQFGFVIFWQKDFGVKAAHKMLLKLTLGWTNTLAYYNIHALQIGNVPRPRGLYHKTLQIRNVQILL